MRKTIAWLCVILTLLTAVPAMAQDSAQRGNSLTVGSPNAMSGHFGTEMWSNNTADMDVRALLHGYETVAWTQDASFYLNPTVVKDMKTEQAQDGSTVYTLTLASNLTYNDGTKITARDYAFGFLLGGAMEIETIGGVPMGRDHIIGYSAYRNGQAQALKGVRVISDTVLQVHIDGSYLPYFYSYALVSVRPYPISVIAPGCEVKDDGQGAYIAGDFSAAVLEKTMLNPTTGYEFYPRITCGPYSLESYDPARNVATFMINERFAGNFEGQKPSIERLTFQYEAEENAIEKLANGEIDLMNKMGDSVGVTEQLEAAGTDSLQQTAYSRSGFGFLAFACEQTPTDSAAVRKAISLCLDRNSLIEQAMPGSAAAVFGYYGVGQWMVLYSDDGAITGKPPVKSIDELNKLATSLDLSAAAALLEADGWIYNLDGQNYDAGIDDVRYKKIGGELIPLKIHWATTTKGPYIDSLRSVLEKNLPQIGVSLTVAELDFPTLLKHYYRQTDRTYNMFFMASNFGFVFDPYYDFNTADEYQGTTNTTGLLDDELMRLARDMRETEPGDYRSYVDKWLLFQKQFAEDMPMAPLYTNVYYDVYRDNLRDYNIALHSGWAYAILYAYVAQ